MQLERRSKREPGLWEERDSAIAHLLLVVGDDAPYKVGLGLAECMHQLGQLLLQKEEGEEGGGQRRRKGGRRRSEEEEREGGGDQRRRKGGQRRRRGGTGGRRSSEEEKFAQTSDTNYSPGWMHRYQYDAQYSNL